MRKFMLFLLLSLLLVGCGKDVIKESDLQKSLDDYISSEDYNYNGYDARLDNNKIVVSYDEHEYELSYNLKDKPTFIYEAEIKKGISYDDFVLKTDALSLIKIGYIAALGTYDINAEDADAYFSSIYLDEMLRFYYEDQKYIVLDDESEGEETFEVITVEEFGERVVEYVEGVYGDGLTIKDKENDTFTYDLTQNCKKDTCTITAKLTINPDAKFENVTGTVEKLEKDNMYEDITPENADYHIELKVGQTIKVTGNDLSGYDLSGMDVVNVEFLDSGYKFKATEEGISNGYFYVGEDEKRTIYVTVTKAEKNEKLENKTLKVK